MNGKKGKIVLVTGATGKVGQQFIRRFLQAPEWADAKIRALCHNRLLEPNERLEVVQGSMAERGDVARAVDGVSHVLHLATCKETPDAVMDVTVKGLFWLLEECRQTDSFEQLVLIGGDAGMGHFVYPHPIPVAETQKHSPYEGCYALSKVLEEVMLEQYYTQYDFNGCCLRAPWIMEKDDFKYTLSFGEDVFGGPKWRQLVGAEKADEYIASGAVPVMLDPQGQPMLRNFVHVEDLADAILAALDHPAARQQLFNICMDEPVDYRQMADYLKRTRSLPSVDISTPFHRTWLDNSKAKFLLGWRPRYDLEKLIDGAWDYQRADDDPRIIWYPG
ncbi:MAG: NAD-dependent epimerase/dehydratase family protein [Candidatus Latescibacteria bacterium]|nr:NAD-dependent epimerase/dehydratase family protein [Candidatus Latescibacterota bacterium]